MRTSTPTNPITRAVSRVIDAASEPLVVSPYVIAELDYLVATRLGVAVELRVLRELASGAWDLPAFGVEDVTAAAAVIQRYADQRLGVADASNVILAGRYATRSIVTLDRPALRCRTAGVRRALQDPAVAILPSL